MPEPQETPFMTTMNTPFKNHYIPGNKATSEDPAPAEFWEARSPEIPRVCLERGENMDTVFSDNNDIVGFVPG